MGKYGEIRRDFLEERDRILNALSQPENEGLILRLVGALAFRTHCPEFGYIQDALGREFTDFDFASYRRLAGPVTRFLTELGYVEDKTVTQLFGEGRLLFHDPKYGRHIDVFFDKLHFSHTIPLQGRLEVETLTLPLAELVLEKMQIVQINEKDLIDTIMLLREHPIGNSDEETINGGIIARLCAKDWGLWRTVTRNLELVKEFTERYEVLTDEDQSVVQQRVDELLERIESAPKGFRWKIRSVVGERMKWYEEVEELANRGPSTGENLPPGTRGG
ncbi:MAG TPA: hypothetical protein EYP52_07570 [Anaerolineae bacterium]|nr:hypothetical protein [Anaerolineae bacterium]